jgi:uncharacterized membrane protein YdbT with pleckstrin-like domain
MSNSNQVVMWKGTPSHLINLDTYFFWTCFSIVILFLVTWNDPQWLNLLSQLPKDSIPYATALLLALPFWKILISYLRVKNTHYELTTERLITSTGIFNREINEMELYRVKDYSVRSPFFQRIFSLGTIILDTSDKSDPFLELQAIKEPEDIRDILRLQVEELRQLKGVREVDRV